MRNKSTLVVLSALFFIFGYYTWEHFSSEKPKDSKKLMKVTEKKKRLQ